MCGRPIGVPFSELLWANIELVLDPEAALAAPPSTQWQATRAACVGAWRKLAAGKR